MGVTAVILDLFAKHAEYTFEWQRGDFHNVLHPSQMYTGQKTASAASVCSMPVRLS